MAKQKQKQARKFLRVACTSCGNTQDSLRIQCSSCKADLHPDVESRDLSRISGEVEGLDAALLDAQNPQGNPYGPVDQAYLLLKSLDKYPDFPGMKEYLLEVRRQLLPFKIAVLQRTFKANLVFLAILLVFPLVPLLFGWPLLVSGLMLLPAIAWGGISLKAWSDYKKALSQQE